jgi:5-methylcytosine-specific restriction endonuclease McrA
MSKSCMYCSSSSHTGFSCVRRPRKPLQAKRPLSKSGKLAKAYAILRQDYLDTNPGPYYCVYCLSIGVEQELTRGEVNVEHYHSKARRPDLRFRKSNLVVSCQKHNADKGSLDGDEFIQKIGGQVGN